MLLEEARAPAVPLAAQEPGVPVPAVVKDNTDAQMSELHLLWKHAASCIRVTMEDSSSLEQARIECNRSLHFLDTLSRLGNEGRVQQITLLQHLLEGTAAAGDRPTESVDPEIFGSALERQALSYQAQCFVDVFSADGAPACDDAIGDARQRISDGVLGFLDKLCAHSLTMRMDEFEILVRAQEWTGPRT
jgi:hypothetical protein